MVVSYRAPALNNAFVHVPGSGSDRQPQPVVMDLARVSNIAGSVTIPPGLSIMARRQYGIIAQDKRITHRIQCSNKVALCDKSNSVISLNNRLLDQTRQRQDDEVRATIHRNNQLLNHSRLQQDNTIINAVNKNKQLLRQTDFSQEEHPTWQRFENQFQSQRQTRKESIQRETATQNVIQIRRSQSQITPSNTSVMSCHTIRKVCVNQYIQKRKSDQACRIFPMPKRICIRPTRRPDHLPNIPHSVLQPSAFVQSNNQRNRLLVVKLPVAVVRKC
ncbi:unnamed protein product [Meganyctiphanes norvegica]|uniref:Uncharacterized protein n=1 Tax=Meganyctiphanes norvegica TaxID=48144 RepID=A0AAV2SC80_MEGNR